MATARVPIHWSPAAAVLHTIVINTTGGSDSPGIIIGDTDTIRFQNDSPFSVAINFICENGPVFTDISDLPRTSTSSTQSPQKTQITTDYEIVNLSNNSVQGPYSIEVTINEQTAAPLLIPITQCLPPAEMATMAIPQRGWVQFNLDQAYDLAWSPSSAFPAPSNPLSKGLSPAYQAATGNQNATATYTFGTTTGKTGGGSVKIRS